MKEWDDLNRQEKKKYIEMAEYLHEHGYFSNIDTFKLAEKLYYKKRDKEY